MKIMIDIDENLYTRLFDASGITRRDMRNACSAIRKGTPLPKGHGRLIDVNSKIEIETGTTLDWIAGATTKKEYTIDYLIEKAGCEVPAIIGGDKEGDRE